MKKIDFKIVFDRAFKVRKRSHLSNAALQRDHLSSLVCHLNPKKCEESLFVEILNEIFTKRSIIELIELSTKK